MSLYSQKQRWKLLLLSLAAVIIGVSMWYSNLMVTNVRTDERRKVELWSQAIEQRATLVNYTNKLFDTLRNEERKKMDTWAKATARINVASNEELTFLIDIITKNTTIPVIIADAAGNIVTDHNLPDHYSHEQKTEALQKMKNQYPPIEIDIYAGMKQYLYYRDSRIITELEDVLGDIINSFINETVINAASVPVILTDSTMTRVISHGNIDPVVMADSLQLQERIRTMALANPPIQVMLGDQQHLIFHEDSVILTQLRYYPIVQFVIIGLFLLIAYLLFSTFRKAEQNQVWVGMAKETAHQLGTPLSSLMAWVELLDAKGVDEETLKELQKDIDRLNTVTERFSKIGSKTELERLNVREVVHATLRYLAPRVSSKVQFSIAPDEETEIMGQVNAPLFSWVIENLCKNAIDAMNGEGFIHVEIFEEGAWVIMDITDTGKGISRANLKAVFKPGYTTKKRGWGLGLSLSKRIIENYHHGKIFVRRSELNKGTTFRIQLRR
ncbi:MAG: sensor histidine kinase [Cryomorphaceae bacterium]|nr:MAG: sensor histidine kinase [Cryomorphaceae bacterium]